MKKAYALILVLMLVGSNVWGADLVITLTIADADKQEIIDGIKAFVPVPDIDNDGTPDFTDEDWVEEFMRRALVSFAQRGDQGKRQSAVRPKNFNAKVTR